ncbi:hypothetical protein [Deinococcus alpinitundrae]|uniref:hypothetical protein n=1 Tax=Deinococcus alpinitundrae TaxID=468913 RepID=UPI00137AB1C4|nr:hypothetical protein [Deinococcus alpinitundrae]
MSRFDYTKNRATAVLPEAAPVPVPVATPAPEPEREQLNVRVSSAAKKRFAAVAALEGETMTSLLERMMTEYADSKLAELVR